MRWETDNWQTPASAEVLGEHKMGWFGKIGKSDLLEVANAPYKSSMKFEEMFICDPTAKHMGYTSWDGSSTAPFSLPNQIPTPIN